jgi:hypothetical protein
MRNRLLTTSDTKQCPRQNTKDIIENTTHDTIHHEIALFLPGCVSIDYVGIVLLDGSCLNCHRHDIQVAFLVVVVVVFFSSVGFHGDAAKIERRRDTTEHPFGTLQRAAGVVQPTGHARIHRLPGVPERLNLVRYQRLGGHGRLHAGRIDRGTDPRVGLCGLCQQAELPYRVANDPRPRLEQCLGLPRGRLAIDTGTRTDQHPIVIGSGGGGKRLPRFFRPGLSEPLPHGTGQRGGQDRFDTGQGPGRKPNPRVVAITGCCE